MVHQRFAAILVFATTAIPALAADVGVSVSIGQPGFYGRIDIGGFPQPQLIYREPIAVQRVPVDRPPIYLRVPPGHEKHWKKHCREYNACGERVLFVHDDWYTREFAPRYQEPHRARGDQRHDDRMGDNRDDRRDDRHDDRGR